MDSISTRPDRLIVIADRTPGFHPTCSAEVGWWLPIIGPTSTVLAVTLAHSAADREAVWDTMMLARTIGLGGSRSRLWASLDRLEQFGCARFEAADILTIRLQLPVLNAALQRMLPDHLAAAYPHMINTQ